jgi:hypothetical protein
MGGSFVLCGEQDGAQNARVRAAATEISGEPGFYLLESGVGSLIQERFGFHDHAVGAVAALSGLFGDECGLYRIGFFVGAESFEGGDRATIDLLHGSHTGSNGFAIEKHGAGAALSEATSEFRTVQTEGIAEQVENRLRRIPGINGDRAAVDSETVVRHGSPPAEGGQLMCSQYTPVSRQAKLNPGELSGTDNREMSRDFRE